MPLNLSAVATGNQDDLPRRIGFRQPHKSGIQSAVMPLLEIKNLTLDFVSGDDSFRAVDSMSSPIHPPGGCPFHPRCPIAQLPRCKGEFPGLREVKPGVWASCHFAGTKIEQSNRANNRNV